MSKPYRPSNGDEGHSFMGAFCFNGCKHHTEDRPCPIMGRSLAYSTNEPGYPKEWVQNDDGTAKRCTAFELDGEPDRVPRCDKTEDMFK